MRVIIASRVFAPEPAAAASRLAPLAREFVARGHEVSVLTSRLPRGVDDSAPVDGLRVRRAPVVRDRTGVVRGYVPYLSFDLPLFFRVLASRRADVYIVEPPPTTGLAMAVATTLLRRPYLYYSADILSDAAATAGSPGIVVRAVRWMERFSWRRAARVLSVSPTVTARLRELGVAPECIAEVGNGVNLEVFTATGEAARSDAPYALYAGTASEVHGAGVFIEAMASVPGLDLVFLGAGSEVDQLRRRADELDPGRVRFLPTASAAEAARWFRGAAMALASVKPESGYSFAFPTKMYAAAACGTPIVYAGEGPGVEFARSSPLGEAVAHDPHEVALAMRRTLDGQASTDARHEQSQWAHDRVSLAVVAARAADIALEIT